MERNMMNKQHAKALMDSIYPGFFEREYIRNIPENRVYDEMLMPLAGFDTAVYDKKFTDDITFGVYEGDLAVLKEAVGQVEEGWVQSYNGKHRAYCGYIGGRIASFCLIEDMGVHTIGGRTMKIGGPGCVGTLPEYRCRGIGLVMVRNVTRILQEEGYDYGYIHYTGSPAWYARLGYETTLRWNRNGII